MSGLILKLSPGERVLVNGAVIENGERRSRISIISPNANILRLRDAIHPNDAKTPVRRVCYQIQLILTGDIDGDLEKQQISNRIEELSQIFVDVDSRKLIAQATQALIENRFYQCMKSLKLLIPREDRVLNT